MTAPMGQVRTTAEGPSSMDDRAPRASELAHPAAAVGVAEGCQPTGRRFRRPVIWAVAAAVLVGAVAGGVWLRRGGTDPLTLDYSEVGFTLPVMEPGKAEFFMGSIYLDHPGKSVEVLEVESLRSPNVEYLGAFTIWPRDFPTNRQTVGRGYPPARLKDRHPAFGTVVPADETAFVPKGFEHRGAPPVVVNVGFRLASGDVGVVNGIRVTYKVDGKKTHKDFRYFAVACVKPNPCTAPQGSIESYADIARDMFGLRKK